jgi:hypothetical protein
MDENSIVLFNILKGFISIEAFEIEWIVDFF